MNKPLLKIGLGALACCLGASSALAIPADPRPRQMVQPDGTIVTVIVRGDEFGHYFFTEDDYLLSRIDNAFYYANINADGKIEASSLLARQPQSRGAQDKAYLQSVDQSRVNDAVSTLHRQAREQKQVVTASRSDAARLPGLYGTMHFPAYGQSRSLVVLVEYPDVKFNTENPFDYFNDMLNKPGFSELGGTGSASDFFIENSRGTFDPQFDVYGPITLKHNRSHYGKNDLDGSDLYPYEMVIEACQQLDAKVDFTQYDADLDGYIDNVYIFYAGQGEADTSIADAVWPHSWNIWLAGKAKLEFDGIRLDRYACSNEWTVDKRPDGVGTFVHEFSHVLGLPDLYSTDPTVSPFTPGPWSTLDIGPYNNNGCTPPNYSMFERTALGWVDPVELTEAATITLEEVTTNQGCIITTPDPDEYFLFENRQKTGWDTYLPGHGMLVWHIHYNQEAFDRNAANNLINHQYVDLVEADNKRNSRTRAGDSFPGTSEITEFTAETTPGLVTWNGVKLDCPITEITETDDGLIIFKVKGGGAGINGIMADKGNITIDGTAISIKAEAGAAVTVTDLLGRTLLNATVPAGGQLNADMPGRGIYLVGVSQKTVKVSI